MKAWILDHQAPIDEQPLKLVELPDPVPGPLEVRLRVLACGICRTDLHIAEGDLPLHRSPIILGHEIVGVVDSVGNKVTRWKTGDPVGVTWLGRTCGSCRSCRSGRENTCPDFQATGWDLDGGFAEYTIVDAGAAFPLGQIPLPIEELAPLMCPGVAGHCAFRLTGTRAGDRLGLYGFGPTADSLLKVARHLGIEVYVSSRSERNLRRAREHGASWAGNAAKSGMPVRLDASVIFPPAGELVEPALEDLVVGGTLVLAPVAMSPFQITDYTRNLWGRDIRTLYNVNRRDAAELLELATHVDLSLGAEVFPFEELPEALIRLRHGRLRAPNAVLRIVDR